MASTYVNNLRLNEMATGDASGTWGTTTNTNLELVGQALGYGTEAITTNADTHASTVADGAADEARAMYIKYTGTLDSACTITIGPNTLKRVHIIENATSGSQSIIIKQGTGATVTIPTGRVAVVYLDGAGSGAAVTNAFTDLDLAGTLSIAGAVAAATDMTVGDDLTLSSDAGVLGFGADTDVTLTHVADTGLLLNSSRQLQFGDSGTYIHQSADGVLDLVADTEIEINATTIDINGAVDISGNALVSGEVQTANIGYTDGDNAITIADGGGITAAAGITSTAASNTFGASSFNDANITNVGSIALDTITNDGSNITLDSSGEIHLDADGSGVVRIMDGGVNYGSLFLDSTTFTIKSETSNNAFSIAGNDGGSSITALTLDMSAAGAATFNSSLSLGGNLIFTAADGMAITARESLVVTIDSDNDQTSRVFGVNNGGGESLMSLSETSGAVFNESSIDIDFRVESNGNANMLFVDGGANTVGIGCTADTDTTLHVNADGSTASTSIQAGTVAAFERSQSTAGAYVAIMGATNGVSALHFGDPDDDDVGSVHYNHSSNFMAFTTDAGEAFRIDNAQNVVFGKAALSVSTSGFVIGSPSAGVTSSMPSGNTYHVYRSDGVDDGYKFYVNFGGTINSTSTSISGLSDVRLKRKYC